MMGAAKSSVRQDQVLHLLRERTSASIPEMAKQFGVSEMTVRRDIERLSDAGQVIRTPGGARLARAYSFEKTFTERLRKMAGAKERVGRAAAALVKEGESLVLDSGTTTLCIARSLRNHKDIVVVTFSLAALDELSGCDSIRVELTGGTYRRSSHDLIGSAVSESLANFQADKVFFGAAALSFERGVMVYDAEAPRALLRAGRQRILVLDSSKIGTQALYRFSPLEACDCIVTDSGVKPEHLARLRKLTKVVVAE